MTCHYNALIKAKDSLHDPDFIMSCLRSFEEDVLLGKVSDTEVQRCLPIISDIGSLSQAACEGIASARQVITKALHADADLETYDADGKKSAMRQSASTAVRF